ncbi:hypothetical protein ACJIZ3_017280 [Penstemon smallii]|uniref:Uncharacterized protein n=1 Tax=Penstemon smallii TaxID=265156 RepID=A0ABD3SW87_9LAMI
MHAVIFLSFWAEVHYNSIYPEGECPSFRTKKKKKKWLQFLIVCMSRNNLLLFQ